MTKPILAVVGNGMVGHRFLEACVARGLTDRYDIVTFAEERRPAYDRVHLSSFFDGTSAADLSLLAEPDWYAANGVRVQLGSRVESLADLSYDVCVLATGSCPFVPPIPGANAAGSFVYRTLDDLEAMRAWATAGASTGVVVGGGLLGLEAANALRNLGLHTTVVEFAPRLMAMQLDEGGGAMLQRHVESLGIDVRIGHAATEVLTTPDGRVRGLAFAEPDHTDVAADIVVFAAGIRPRDELGRAAGLEIGERGGIVVDDTLMTSAPGVYAIGEVACHRGRVYGLVAPGYQMADVLATRLAGDPAARFEGASTSTTLKLLGVDVAVAGVSDDVDAVVINDPVGRVYKKLCLDADGRATGAILVGDASVYGSVQVYCSTNRKPGDALTLLSGAESAGDDATVCSCHNVSGTAIRSAIRDNDLCDIGGVKACTKAGTGCGSCAPVVNDLLRDEMQAAGKEVSRGICEHFAHTRQEIFDIVRLTGMRTFAELIAQAGSGRGCEICKPAVASMFASLSSGYILDGEQASLQDTNDHFLANLQRDGTYSVIPRIPGGEITPEKLIVIGEVAREFDLYTKITGAQRIDMFGARVDQLPAIWRRLVDAGFESGHAYGKALRTVKSCVGTTWCRFGVQDSVQLAIDLELRYRGLRAPHKIKSAVSGCARECAEAQGKDFGVIATERGWNLYVCGNGGMRPQHGVLLAEDLDREALIRYIDRFLMLYIRTADRLERTATWLNKLDGGIEYLRRVIVDDALGLGAELEADMQRHVDSYQCEWRATLDDPERLARFQPFINDSEPDPDLAYVRVRGQRQPI